MSRFFAIFTLLAFLLTSIGSNAVQAANPVVPDASLAHYIVFHQNGTDAPQPVYYRLVTLSAPLTSLSPAEVKTNLALSERNNYRYEVAVLNPDGKTVYQSVVEPPRWLRGEFKGDQPGDPIDGHYFTQENPSFVVRIPVVAGSSLVLKNSAGKQLGVYHLETLTAETPTSTASEAIVTPQSDSPASNRVDILVMGDGYTAAQSGKFDTDSSNFMSGFFGISPLGEYENYINIVTLFNPSTQSGADHPPYVADCPTYSDTCCGDPEMLNDPLAGTFVKTAFDARYCLYNIHRLLVVDDGKVLTAAADYPDWDTIIVLVNDTTYGGSGGTVAVASTNNYAVTVVQHEFGHTFIGLADEYESAYPGFPACSDLGGGSPCEANVTDVSSRYQIKWSPWILDTTPIPTPETYSYRNVVGLFEGARYLTTKMYRPGYSCMMRSLNTPFCAVPSQEFVLQLYRGGWGEPASGISMFEPNSFVPSQGSITLTYPATQTFQAGILEPVGGPDASISWYDNDTLVSTQSNSFLFQTNLSSPGLHVIRLEVSDRTSLVHPAMDENRLSFTHSWNVQVNLPPSTIETTANPATVTADGVSSSVITATVLANGSPASGQVVQFGTTLGTLTSTSGTTNASGVVTTTLTSPQVGNAVVTASTGTINDQAEVQFVAGPPALLTLTAIPNLLPAGTPQVTVLDAWVTDATENPLNGLTVTFSTPAGTLSAPSAVTDSSGHAQVNLTITADTGIVTVQAAHDTLNDSADIHFSNNIFHTFLGLIQKAFQKK